MAYTYVVRTAFGNYRRGDVVENPDVVPEHILNATCTRFETPSASASTAATIAKPDAEK